MDDLTYLNSLVKQNKNRRNVQSNNSRSTQSNNSSKLNTLNTINSTNKQQNAKNSINVSEFMPHNGSPGYYIIVAIILFYGFSLIPQIVYIYQNETANEIPYLSIISQIIMSILVILFTFSNRYYILLLLSLIILMIQSTILILKITFKKNNKISI